MSRAAPRTLRRPPRGGKGKTEFVRWAGFHHDARRPQRLVDDGAVVHLRREQALAAGAGSGPADRPADQPRAKWPPCAPESNASSSCGQAVKLDPRTCMALGATERQVDREAFHPVSSSTELIDQHGRHDARGGAALQPRRQSATAIGIAVGTAAYAAGARADASSLLCSSCCSTSFSCSMRWARGEHAPRLRA